MDYIVEKTPDECLTAAQAYFIREWPYKGTVSKGDDLVIFTENDGCLGAFMITMPKRVQLFATAEPGRKCRLTMNAGRSDHARTMDEWLRDGLGAEPA